MRLAPLYLLLCPVYIAMLALRSGAWMDGIPLRLLLNATFAFGLWDPALTALLIGGCLYATLSLAVAINTIRPRLFRNASHGHIFWEDITAQKKEDYAHGLQHLRVGEIYRELGEHNHNLANTALRKFRWLRVGFLMALTSIVLSAILILFTN